LSDRRGLAVSGGVWVVGAVAVVGCTWVKGVRPERRARVVGFLEVVPAARLLLGEVRVL